MWLKLFFLLLYFLVLFVLARFFEAIVWYETGIFATQLVDPVALSFKKLKTILECRGLGYSGLPEKKDVRELVEKSGEYRAPLGSPPPGGGGDLYFLVLGGSSRMRRYLEGLSRLLRELSRFSLQKKNSEFQF